MREPFRYLPDAGLDQIMIANRAWPEFARTHADAVNTTIGVLVNPETGKPWRPQTLIQAEVATHNLMADHEQYGYQTPSGSTAFLEEASKLVLGECEPVLAEDVFKYQTAGGTNALFLARELLQNLMIPDQDGALPVILDAGWPNHHAIFDPPFKISTYQHSNTESLYDHQAALDAFSQAPQRSVFLLQTCGYNDDGNDRTHTEWEEILSIAQEKEAVVLLDAAYLGLAHSFEEDSLPIRECVKRGLLTFVALSTSKNMGLYGERLGALFVANAPLQLGDAQAANLNQLAGRCIRRTISSPQTQVAEAAAVALKQDAYYAELKKIHASLTGSRDAFAAILGERFPNIANGQGLFTKLLHVDFSPSQLDSLREDGIHVLPNTRINLGGIKPEKIERVGNAILHALENQ
jgi:aromatic-amino-acid transaminase